MRSLESKQPKHAVKGSSRSAEFHFDQVLSDSDCFERALREYRETSWDDSSFEKLPFEAQQTILRRAEEIKGSQRRLQAILGGRHPIRFLMDPLDLVSEPDEDRRKGGSSC
jgi:hypothetical protein